MVLKCKNLGRFRASSVSLNSGLRLTYCWVHDSRGRSESMNQNRSVLLLQFL